jgi:hypothetical protein
MAIVEYKLIKNFFDSQELSFLQKYTDKKLDEFNCIYNDSQSFSAAWYNDITMSTFLETKLKRVEEESKLKLFSTYAYWRYYVFGGTLKNHTDRPACEVSVTANIKTHDEWPMIVEDSEFYLGEGDAVLYAGCVHNHSRPGIYKGNGMAQVFLHYVDQNGPFTHHAGDNYKNTTGEKCSESDEEIKTKLKEEYDTRR